MSLGRVNLVSRQLGVLRYVAKYIGSKDFRRTWGAKGRNEKRKVFRGGEGANETKVEKYDCGPGGPIHLLVGANNSVDLQSCFILRI